MNITLVMSSSITTTLTMGVLLAVGAAVAYSKLVLVRMNVPGAFRNRTSLGEGGGMGVVSIYLAL